MSVDQYVFESLSSQTNILELELERDDELDELLNDDELELDSELELLDSELELTLELELPENELELTDELLLDTQSNESTLFQNRSLKYPLIIFPPDVLCVNNLSLKPLEIEAG